MRGDSICMSENSRHFGGWDTRSESAPSSTQEYQREGDEYRRKFEKEKREEKELKYKKTQEYQLDFEEYRAHPRSLSPEESKKFDSVMLHLMEEAYYMSAEIAKSSSKKLILYPSLRVR